MARLSHIVVRCTRLYKRWAVAALAMVLMSTLTLGDNLPEQWPADEYIAKAQAAVNNSQQQNDKSLAAIESMFPRGGVFITRAVGDANHQLRQLRQEVDARECPAHAKRAGVPADLLNALYLIEWANPTSFYFLPCTAVRHGVKFRFSAEGLFSKDSFEIKGTRSMRVTLAREIIPGSKTVVFVPIEVRIDGETFEVTRANLQSLALHLRMAVNNE